jgi:hypothetical protein
VCSSDLNPDRKATNAPFGWQMRVLKKAYSLTGDVPIQFATLEQIQALSRDTTKPTPRRTNLKLGSFVVFDIGGSDIKFGAVINGRFVFYKEYVWSPEQIFDPFAPITTDGVIPAGHVPTLLTLRELARLKMMLEQLRAQNSPIYAQLAQLEARIDETVAHFDSAELDHKRARAPLYTLKAIVDEAKALEATLGISLFAPIDGIGLSVNVSCVANKPVGFGPLIEGLVSPEAKTIERFTKLGKLNLKDVAKDKVQEYLLANLPEEADKPLRSQFAQASAAAKLQTAEKMPERLAVIENIATCLTQDLEGVAAVFNDGAALAFWAAVAESASRYFVFSLGSGVA